MQIPHSACFLDLNLLPPRFRPRHFPVVPVALGLLVAVGVLLLLAIVQFKGAVDADVTRLQTELRGVQVQLSPPAGQAQGGAVASWAKFRIGWSRVLQNIVASAPSDVRLQNVAFSVDTTRGPQAIIKGEGTEYAAVIEYADNLHSSPFFARVSIQSMGEAPPITGTVTPASNVPASATPGQIVVPPVPSRAPTSLFVPPTPQTVFPTWTTTPSAARSSTPNVWPTFVVTTVTPTNNTTTATAKSTPTRSKVDFILVQRDTTCNSTAPIDYAGNLIGGRVLDVNGSGLASTRLRVTSTHTSTPWSADTWTDSQGSYYFWLTKANYKVQVLDGSSEVASELWTLSTQETGVCTWTVSFQKNNSGTPVVQPTSTATLTATPTATGTRTPSPTITPTPPPGTVIRGTATASSNAGDAGLAVDGDANTSWNAGDMPYQYWEESFPSAYNVSGINLVVSQNPSGSTRHVVHFYTNMDEIPSSALTITGYTFEGQEISRSFAAPISGVNRVRVETIDGPSYVSWREVKVFTVPTPTPTPSPTATPRGQGGSAWQSALPIDPGVVITNTFYNPSDTDWVKFYNGSGYTRTYSFRAFGQSQIDLALELDKLIDGSLAYRGYNDNQCGIDPILTFTLDAEGLYYLKVSGPSPSYLHGMGTHTITMIQGTLACDGSITAAPSAVPLASAAGPARSPLVDSLALPQLAAGRGPGLSAPTFDPFGHPPGDASHASQAVIFTIVVDISPGSGP